MLTLPIVLLVGLLVVVAVARARKSRGQLSEGTYRRLVSVSASIVTIVAIAVLVLRLRM